EESRINDVYVSVLLVFSKSRFAKGRFSLEYGGLQSLEIEEAHAYAECKYSAKKNKRFYRLAFGHHTANYSFIKFENGKSSRPAGKRESVERPTARNVKNDGKHVNSRQFA
ncbi:MAG: hypothetical protein LBH85_10085, partial [Treponema sp.]|nr:hypothetical protein [Treponema sp.]